MKLIIITIILQVVVFTYAISCNCEDPGTVAEAYNYNETIIYGKVVKKEFVSFGYTMELRYCLYGKTS